MEECLTTTKSKHQKGKETLNWLLLEALKMTLNFANNKLEAMCQHATSMPLQLTAAKQQGTVESLPVAFQGNLKHLPSY